MIVIATTYTTEENTSQTLPRNDWSPNYAPIIRVSLDVVAVKVVVESLSAAVRFEDKGITLVRKIKNVFKR